MRKTVTTQKKVLLPDQKYNNPMVTKFINYVMKDGKKTVARTVVYDAFDIMAKKTKKDPMDVFDEAIKNVSPVQEVISKRVGGANYQVPKQVKGERRITLAMRWILSAARSQSGSAMSVRLAQVLMDSANNTGGAVKKKEDIERMARANRAFAHFA